jgi:formylglycine-generating enzyme required for sulfatase activity
VAAAKPLFSIWDTRVQDYQAFVNETHHHWIKPGFQQSETHPAVNVSWADAQEFCQWLTDRERRAGKLSDQQQYRLPTDAEWSAAAGPTKFPWGNQWPPPARAGNYSPSLNVDEYKFTSPTGTFPPNAAGLYDMGGNVWQWCQDWFREEMNSSEGTAAHPDPKNGRRNTGERVVRGGSYYVGSGFSNVNSARRYIETSTRIGGGSPNTRNANNGFRCVLADSANTATDATKQAGVQ